MRIKIGFYVNENFKFNKNLNEAMTAFIYRCISLSDKRYGAMLHDKGYRQCGYKKFVYHVYSLSQNGSCVKDTLNRGMATLILSSALDKTIIHFTRGLIRIGKVQLLSHSFDIISIKNIDEPKIESIDVFAEGRFEVYHPLYELYLEKNPENKRYSLSELLNYAKEDGAINKEKYLSNVLQDLHDDGYFKVTNPVALYDNILVGRKVTPSGSGKTISQKEHAPDHVEDEFEDNLSLYHKYANLLDFNPNIILYGPPGTGKTYAALKIVEAYEKSFSKGKYISSRELEKQGRLKFLTFHQAYSYEEFIEGIRPRLDNATGSDEKESLGYSIEDGILKQIAISASRQRLQAEAKGDGMESVSESSKIWKLSLGRRDNDTVYIDCKQSNCIAIGWFENDDLTGKTYEELLELAKSYNTDEDPKHAADCLDKFINVMSKGDIVLIYNSHTTIRDIAVVTEDYKFNKDKEYPHRRKVTWIKEFKHPFLSYRYTFRIHDNHFYVIIIFFFLSHKILL